MRRFPKTSTKATRLTPVVATVLLTATIAMGCRSAAPSNAISQPPTAAQAEHLEIEWVAKSAEYRALLFQTYRLAGERLEELVAGREAGTWAVAIDADETLISNVRYQQEIAAAGEEYSSASFGRWTERREAAALPGAQEFLELTRRLGGKIAVVTNRRVAWCPDTEANLDAIGLPYDIVLCRGEDREKESRWEKLEKGTASPDLPPLDLVMFLGDNIKDFPELDQTLAAQGEGAHKAFGVEFFVLPNPMYGSWDE